MKLLSCHIDAFGRFRDREFSFVGGVNSLCAPNGFGKTTAAAFLRAMFYGMESYRAGSREFPERQHYYPADASGNAVYGGSVTFETGGKTYRIERRFGEKNRKDDRMTVYCGGQPTEELGECPGKTLFGIDADSFSRTVFIDSVPVPGGATPDIARALHRYVEDCENGPSAADAAERLREAAFRLRGKQKSAGKIPQLEQELASVRQTVVGRRAVESALDGKYENRRRLCETGEALRRERKAAQEYEILAAKYRVYEEKSAAVARTADLLAALKERYPAGIPGTDVTDVLSEAGRVSAEVGRKNAPDSLISVFSAGKPDPAAYGEMRARAERLEQTERQIAALETRNPASGDEYRRLKERFAQGIPADYPERTEAEAEACRKADRELAALVEQVSSGEKKRNTLEWIPVGGMLAAVALIGIGLLLLLKNSTARIPVMIAGVALLAVSLTAAIVITGRKRKNAGAREIGMMTLAADKKRHTENLFSLLAPYGYTGTDVFSALAEFRRDGERYRLLRAQSEDCAREAADLSADSADLRRELEAFLGAHKIPSALLTAAGIRAGVDRAEQMRERYVLFEETRELIGGVVKAWSLPLPPPGGEEALSADIRRDREACERLRTELEEKRRDAADYRARECPEGLPPAPPRTPAEIDGEILQNDTALARADREIEECEAETAGIPLLEERAAELRRCIEELEEKRRILLLAADGVEAADSRIKERYIAPVREGYLRSAAQLGNALRNTVTVDPDFNLRFDLGGALRDERYLSDGQRVLSSFCLRLSLIDSIYTGEKPFLLLDDPFSGLDDEHMPQAAAFLRELGERYQILYFCCHESRALGKETEL